MAETKTEDELHIERVFDAPREQVFKAWLDPEQLSKWYGPAHMEAPQERITVEPQVGGRWELVMTRGDGEGEFPLRSRIVELVEPELIVIENEAKPDHGMGATRTRVEFHDEGDKTRMVLTDGPFPEGMGEMAGKGWTAAFDKLAGVLTA